MTPTTKPIYAACAEAADRLLETPPDDHGGVFTELDVIAQASTPEWSPSDYQAAMRQASQVCGLLFRSRRLCRYGPVQFDGTRDYARIATKIVYGNPESGPKVFKTPNGSFKRIMIEDDDLGHQGRRAGTNRDDLVPWDKHQEWVERHAKSSRRNLSEARLKELEDLVESLSTRNATLENRNRWLELHATR